MDFMCENVFIATHRYVFKSICECACVCVLLPVFLRTWKYTSMCLFICMRMCDFVYEK